MMNTLAQRRLLIVGLGESGMAMARFAQAAGAASVRVVDTRAEPPKLAAMRAELAQASFESSELDHANLDGVDMLAISPGLSPYTGASAALLDRARRRRIEIVGELDLFARALDELRASRGYSPRVLAITGTNGKTTATKLTAHLLTSAGRAALACGNVSPAMLDALLGASSRQALPDYWVVELSSFQLEFAGRFRADCAAILNVTQDHLDWHGSMQRYIDAKQRIYHGAPVRVFNRADPLTKPPAAPQREPVDASPVRRTPAGDTREVDFGDDAPSRDGALGIVEQAGVPWLAQYRDALAAERFIARLIPANALRIVGRHNQLNALAALALASSGGLPIEALLDGLRDYHGEAHRCELIATINGVDYYDDSKGTNVGATVAALDGLAKTVVLIAGGDGKNQDFGPLIEPVKRHAKAVLLIGRDAPLLRHSLSASGVALEDFATLEAAVERAGVLAGAGEAVLLSPACASLDMFRNYAHRAQVFVDAVKRLGLEAGQPC